MCTVQDILTNINLLVGTAKDFIEIIVAIIGGICAVKGISYLQTLKEKRNSAIFTFWSQLYVHVYALYAILKESYGVVNGLYSEQARTLWSSSDDEVSFPVIEQFFLDAQKTLAFIETAPDQMPAYEEWTEDYQALIQFLIEVTRYDITDFNRNFLFRGNVAIDKRDEYCRNVCDVMTRLLEGMKREQKEATEKIYKCTQEQEIST